MTLVLIYGKPGCGFCVKAKQLAESCGIKYTYKDIVATPEFREELFRVHPETKTVPQIWMNNKHVGGYHEFAAEIENTGMGNYGEGAF
tara:strand:+ start:1035 stop:1298 length:264 start_codon:yes stop_codon:yes gene_type:complete